MRTKLTESTINRLTLGDAREVWDSMLSSFGLRITPEGRKSFMVMYRANGVQRRQKLGNYPTLSLATARKLARKAFAEVAQGKDPSAEKRERREVKADAFEMIAMEFLERYCKRHKRVRSVREDERLIRKELLPRWGSRRITEISKADVIKLLDITSDRAPILANRLLSFVRKLCNWAQERGYLETSPCIGVRAPSKERARERVLTDGELASLRPAFEAMGYPYGPLLEILLLTGQRVGEVAGMAWAEVDIEQALWTLPAARSKNNRGHVLPLARPVLDILAALPRLGGFVFSFGDSPVRGFSKVKRRLDAMSGAAGWRLHDLRRTVATNLARLGTPPHVVSEILGHAPTGITRAVYDRYSYQREMRDALERWAAFLAVGGAEVVPIRA